MGSDCDRVSQSVPILPRPTGSVTFSLRLRSRRPQVRILSGAPLFEWRQTNDGQSVEGEIHLRALLLADRPKLAAALPNPGHRLPQFLVSDVQVALRLLDVGMAEHQLDRADVHAVCEEPRSSFVT
jgi:hypothetical protein